MSLKSLIEGNFITPEEAEKLTDQEKDILNSYNISNLIQKGKIGVKEALGLSDQQIEFLESDVFDLIENEKITVKEALDLDEQQREILDSIRIVKLIENKKITVKEALGLDEQQREILNTDGIFRLIQHGNITITEALAFNFDEQQREKLNAMPIVRLIIEGKITINEVVNLNEQQIENLDSDRIFNLIENGKITIEAAIGLTEQERKNLDSGSIVNLIEDDLITVEAAKKLTEEQIGILENFYVYDLIRDGIITFERFVNADSEEQQFLMVYGIYGIYRVLDAQQAVDFLEQIDNPNATHMYDLLLRGVVTLENAVNLSKEGITELFRNNPRTQPTVHDPQTVHDRKTESTIQDSIDNLSRRYGTEPSSLESIVLFLTDKANKLQSSGKLTADEIRVINANFKNLLSLRTREDYTEDQELKAVKLLRLAINALEDQDIAKQMCGYENGQKLDDDMNDRWAGWFRSAIIDSQLAYRRDRGDMSIPSDDELNKDQSCFGGSLNRIIVALNLIHPDVIIQAGQKTLASIELYFKDRQKGVINEFGQNIDTLQGVVKKYLESFKIAELKEILRELKELEKFEEAPQLDQKSERLKHFEENLHKHIVSSAKLHLKGKGIEGEDDLISKTLQPFTSAYIDGPLQNNIQKAIRKPQRVIVDPEGTTVINMARRQRTNKNSGSAH